MQQQQQILQRHQKQLNDTRSEIRQIMEQRINLRSNLYQRSSPQLSTTNGLPSLEQICMEECDRIFDELAIDSQFLPQFVMKKLREFQRQRIKQIEDSTKEDAEDQSQSSNRPNLQGFQITKDMLEEFYSTLDHKQYRDLRRRRHKQVLQRLKYVHTENMAKLGYNPQKQMIIPTRYKIVEGNEKSILGKARNFLRNTFTICSMIYDFVTYKKDKRKKL